MASADDKCGTVVHGNYYAGANQETKVILQGIQEQLSEMQEQLREIKICNGNKTGEEKISASLIEDHLSISPSLATSVF